jgi:hypothetical protein
MTGHSPQGAVAPKKERKKEEEEEVGFIIRNFQSNLKRNKTCCSNTVNDLLPSKRHRHCSFSILNPSVILNISKVILHLSAFQAPG